MTTILCTSVPPLQLSEAADNGATSNSGISSLSFSVGVLEVAEHLPFPSSAPASSVGSYGSDGWLPAEEMSRVPGLLPSAPHIKWPRPTFAGEGTHLQLADVMGHIGASACLL